MPHSFSDLWIYAGILDPALRPDRIDRKFEFPPGPEARVSILRIHYRKVNIYFSF